MKKLGLLVFSLMTVGLLAVGCAETDAGLTTKVKAKLAADDLVKAHEINVDTANGIVTLTGTVDSVTTKERAIALTRETTGVRDVVDRMSVDRAGPASGVGPALGGAADQARQAAREIGQEAREAGRDIKDVAREGTDAVSDAGITAAVKTKFLADTRVGGLKIDVDTTDGVVTLTGKVNAAQERDDALRIARETSGVKRVVDKLTVAK
jgi:hyperosmotically inducible protein